jgi:uncharacterized protein (DUF362 family)
MHRKVTRREWMAATAGAALLAGCKPRGPAAAQAEPSRVSIVRAPAYDQSLYDTMRRIVAVHRLDVRGRSVVLKPNLVEFEPENTINTHPLLVHATYEAFLAAGAASVRIAEGPGHRRNTLDLADAAGYFRIVPNFDDMFVDLNLDDVTRVRPRSQFSRIEKLYLPNTVLGADLLVSMAKMKGNGPIQGVPKQVGVVVAGRDPLAVDATCCRVMRIDPFRIGYLRLAAADYTQIAEANIVQTGERIAAVATPFALIPEFKSIRLG